MTDLTVGRLSATVHGDGDLAPRVGRMLTQLAQRRLDDALQSVDLPNGEWCVRRVDVGIVIDPERPDGAIETHWATAVVDALRRALRTGSDDVVCYPRPGDAVADLVGSVAVGRLERAWAWRRMGVLAPDDPQPESAPAEAVLAVLRRHPPDVLAVLVRAAGRVGVAALHRLLSAPGWVELARLVVRGFETGSRPTGSATQAGQVAIGLLAAELIERSTLAGAFARSRLRPDPVTAPAWAVLIAAETDPSVLFRPVAAAVVAEVTQLLAGAARTTAAMPRVAEPVASPNEPPSRDRPPSSPPTVETATPAHSPIGSGLETDQRAGPAELALAASTPDAADPQRARRCTGWAGLLFLINTAAAADIPDALFDDPALATRTVPWVLHGIARQLVPAAEDDPAVLAFAGLANPPTSAASDIEYRRLGAHAHRWAVATAGRLDCADEDPLAVVAELVLRRGEITAEPGWVEVLLPLADVDIDVRRAGLDIDPGWVHWLGTVVRFGYG